jgi:hypothetical protein
MHVREEQSIKLVQNAVLVHGAGNPAAALVLLDEALRLAPGHPLAVSLKKQIESRLISWMREQRLQTMRKAVEDALVFELGGEIDKARRLAVGVLAMDPGHVEARQILDRLDQPPAD